DCLVALHHCAEAMHHQVRTPYLLNELPPPDRKPTVSELHWIKRMAAEITATHASLRPILGEFKDHLPAVIESVGDADPRCRVAAAEALEAIGELRLRLERLVASVGDCGAAVKELPPEVFKEPLTEPLQKAAPVLAKQLADKD